MRLSGTVLCAIPRAFFEASKSMPLEPLPRFLQDLTVLERRLLKKVAIDDERLRHAQLCRRIEEVVLANAEFAPTGWAFPRAMRRGVFPAVRVGPEYLDLIRQMHLRGEPVGLGSEARIGVSVFDPDQLKRHVEPFAKAAEALGFDGRAAIQHRLWFIRKRLLPAGCGLVEVPDPLGASAADHDASRARAVDGRSLWDRLFSWLRKRRAMSSPAALPAAAPTKAMGESTEWMQYGEQERGRFMEDRLRSQIEEAIARGVAVNLSNQRHNMATQVLAEFIHRGRDEQPALAPVMYNDSLETRPFPLRCLTPLPDGWVPTREFHIGLISMRHLPLDRYIDINWYRNAEVPSSAGLAAADEATFQLSMRQLAALLEANRGHRLRLHVYHTGFLPAVIGFYRAVVTTLTSGAYPAGSLQVVPKLQPTRDNSGYIEGAPWPR